MTQLSVLAIAQQDQPTLPTSPRPNPPSLNPSLPTPLTRANDKAGFDRRLQKTPNILVLTDNCVAQNHGTGTVLLRHFAAYPAEHLLNVFSFQEGEPAFAQRCRIRPRFVPGLLKKGLMQLGVRLPGRVQKRLEAWAFQKRLRNQIEATGFVPDLIYATCFGLRGFTILAQLVAEYGGTIPIIQHFFDYQRDENVGVEALLRQLSPAMTEIWSLGENMAAEVAQQMQRRVQIVPIFHCDLPAVYKTEHRPFGADFQAVMLGNCWIPELFTDIRMAWRSLAAEVGELRPIKWYAHPVTVATLRKHQIVLEPEIHYAGFYQGRDLLTALQSADMAIIPFNREEVPENDYARFSLPSRITEIAGVGLPIFCAAGPQTELQRYVERNAIGVCALPSQREQFQSALRNFVENQALRSHCGTNARQLAANEFDLQQYQTWLYQKLTTVAHEYHR